MAFRNSENNQTGIVNRFVDEWRDQAKAGSILHLALSPFGAFEGATNSSRVSSLEEISTNSRFDLILGDLTLGMPNDTWTDAQTGEELKTQRNWMQIYRSLFHLKNRGSAIYLLEPRGFSGVKGAKFEAFLNGKGYYVQAIFNAPDKILQPETSLTPIFTVIARNDPESLYIAELTDEEQATKVVENYFTLNAGTTLASGKFIDSGSFRGFHHIEVQQQIDRLETQYKIYHEYRFGDIAKEINRVKSGETFTPRENSVYIPTIGNSNSLSNLADAKLKHHNYFQVVFDDNVDSEYVAAFFRSTLGRLILSGLTSQSFIPHVNKRDLEDAVIAIPETKEQQVITNTLHKLGTLRDAIDKLDKELALNPTSSSLFLSRIDNMLSVIDALTDADRVRGIVREGESKRVEFKESLGLDVKKGTKEKYIELSALKTVAAFLNTDGGILLIGVSDDGDIPGVNNEIDKFYKSKDNFLLHWKNLIKSQVGENFYPLIEYHLVEVDDKLVLIVEAQPSQNPCYLGGSDFYVRTNPATDKLEGPKLVDYVTTRFRR